MKGAYIQQFADQLVDGCCPIWMLPSTHAGDLAATSLGPSMGIRPPLPLLDDRRTGRQRNADMGRFPLPVLRVLSDGATLQARDLHERVADEVDLTDKQRAETIDSGQRGALVVRVDGQLVVARRTESRIRRRPRVVSEPPQRGSHSDVDIVVTDESQGQAAPWATASMSAGVKVGRLQHLINRATGLQVATDRVNRHPRTGPRGQPVSCRAARRWRSAAATDRD